MSTSRDGASPKDLGPSAQPAPAVRFDGVWLRRGEGNPLLRGVSFALAPGSFHVLTGPPGSGKTSLMRLVCLAETPTQGRVQVFGRDAATLSRKEATLIRRRIGSALQPAVFADHLTVWDNAALVPRIVGRRPDDFTGEVDEVLKWMGLAKLADSLPGALSDAERHRLAIARAVVNRPELLLVDEAPGEHDLTARQRVLKLLDELHRAGATILMATRDEPLAAASGYPALRLSDGRVSVAEPDPT